MTTPLLSHNKLGQQAYMNRKDKQDIKPPSILSAIRSAADEFFVIERGQTDVVVPYAESEELLSRYTSAYSDGTKRKLLRELGRFSVSLYTYQIEELSKKGALSDCEGITVLARGFYSQERGVDLEGNHEFLYVGG